MGPSPRTSTDIDTFKYDVNQDFYLCQNCETHISLQSQLLIKYSDPESNKHFLLFEDMINVVPDNDKFITNKKTTVSSTYCTKCSADIGFRFIALEEPKDEIQEGRFIVFAEKVMLWKGKKLLDAVTEEPVEKILSEVIGEPGSVHSTDGANEEPVEKKTVAEVTKKRNEKKLQLFHLQQQLKLLSEAIEYQAKKTLLAGVTEELVEKNMPEAVTFSWINE